MDQLNMFEIMERKPVITEAIKKEMLKVTVEVTKRHTKAELVYRLKATEEEAKSSLSEYFERIKAYLDVVDYKFVSFEKI